MMERGVAIHYGDVSPEAKENFYPESTDAKFNTLKQLQQYNLNFPNYANPCEAYSVSLDGRAVAFPSIPESANLGLLSKQMSNDDGTFDEPIFLEFTSEGQYSSQGFTLTFDTFNNIYATRVKIKWLRITGEGISILAEEEFEPTSAFYFCRKFVENFNKVEMTFYSINMPRNRMRLRVVDYGYGTIFYGEELRNVKLIQEINPISTEITINPVDFTIDSKSDIEYSFQAKQPLSVYFNGDLRATTFVKTAKRKSKFLWDIQSEDYIGIMDGVYFYGGIYDGKDAYELMQEIFAFAKVPCSINEDLKGVRVYGYIPFSTCREALMQVAFAVQNVVDTSNSSVVKVYVLENDVKQTIPLERIMQGQSFVDEETVTGIEVVVHKYIPISEDVEVYNAKESGSGEEIFVNFSEPLHDLTISGGNIIESGTNYAIINANSGCVLSGKKYDHITQTRRKKNPVVLASEIEKVVSIENATLVSSHNIDNIIEKCYNWLVKTSEINLKIVEGKHIKYGDYIRYGQKKWGEFKWGEKTPNVVTYDQPVNLGDVINAETEYLGTLGGRIIKQSFSLNGNIIVKEAVLK